MFTCFIRGNILGLRCVTSAFSILNDGNCGSFVDILDSIDLLSPIIDDDRTRIGSNIILKASSLVFLSIKI